MKTTHLTPALQNTAGTQLLSPRWPTWGGVLNRLALFLCLVALLAGAALVAHAAISPHAVAASHTCHATKVTLHGTAAPPTIRCLDGTKATVQTRSTGGVGPLAHLAFASYCSAAALVVYKGYNETGAYLCINGSGLFNMTSVAGWNDAALSFWTGCYDVTFAVDIFMNGQWSPTAYGSYEGLNSYYHNFPYYDANGVVGPDQMSSLTQWPPSYGGPDCIG